MFKSRPAKDDMTVTEPVRKAVMATAMVTESTNRHSWMVDPKHSGRALGSLIGGETASPRSASSAINMLQPSTEANKSKKATRTFGGALVLMLYMKDRMACHQPAKAAPRTGQN